MVTLAACGGSPGAGDSSGSAAPPATSGPTPTGTSGSGTAPTTGPTSGPTSASTYLPIPEPELTIPATRLGRLERRTGIVGAGVEAGCRMLTPDDGGAALQLLVGDARVVDGTRVTVEGYRNESIMTTCQQGVPFTVTKVVAATPAR